MLHEHRRPAVPGHVARHGGRAKARRAAGRRSASTRVRTRRAIGICACALAGGAALFAIFQFGNLEALLGDAAARLPMHAPAAPGIYRPAGERSGCTQAPIDRASGQTTPSDCHTMAPGDSIVRA